MAAVRFFVAFCLLLPNALEAQQEYTVRDIIQHWSNREANTRSVRVQWKEVRFGPVSSRNSKLGSVPSELEKTLLLSGGDLARYSFSGTWPTGVGSELVEHQLTEVLDGDRSVSFDPNPAFIGHPVAVINKPGMATAYSTYETLPIVWFYRPISRCGYTAESLRLRDERAVKDGRSLMVLSATESGRFRVKLWIDPERDFNIARHILSRQNGTIFRQIDVEYKQDSFAKWIPTAWRIVVHEADGSLREDYTSTATQFEINALLLQDDFQIELPIGTVVSDVSAEKELNYVVRSNEEKRIILPEEYGASYEKVVSTETGGAVGRISSVLRWIVICSVSGAAALFCFCKWVMCARSTR